jgi:23S rRNA (cytidine1920-2'-O)/16S rRNA (cytidine1409-2'-O)-methyltransferase
MNAEAKTAPSRLRLDELLVTRGYYQSRSRARDAVARGVVRVAGLPVTKPGTSVGGDAEIAVEDPAARYVARSALKLIAGLEAFGVDPVGGVALDIGASTGGFTQVLLERGAKKIFAIDVGHGQLDPTLSSDHRVILREGLNARDLTLAEMDGEGPDLVVCDVSFISLKLALPPALALAAPGAKGVFLVKPQFEAGREAIGKGGLLKDPNVGPAIAGAMAQWLETVPGWRVLGLHPSPIEGGDGNREFLLGAIKDRA